ncbi:MAG: HAMP domain-containing protein [Oscillospiraceae bacterium]|nr:HAMP domain-containing protein [Oscillospiraceae bacterium]
MAQESIKEMKKSVKGTMLLITLILMAMIILNVVIGMIAQAKLAEKNVTNMLSDNLGGAYAQMENTAEYLGIQISDLAPDDLANMFKGNSCDTIIVDQSGKVLAAYFMSGNGLSSYAAYVQKSGQTSYYPQAVGGAGVRRCYAAKAIEGTSNTLVVGSPSGEYYSGLIASFWANVVLIVLLAIMIVVMNIFFSKVITTPLDKIRAKIIDMAGGNLSGERLDINSDNDLGVLASSVNNLADSTRNIIGDIRVTAEEIARDNLKVKPTAQYNGDFLPVKTALEGIVDSMKTVVANVDAAGREVSNSSTQMSSNSAVLSQAAREGSDTVSELSASLNRVHDQINTSTEKAALAKDLTDKSVAAINEGNEKMMDMLSAMKEINATSAKIANIIKTIQDISFQTNILSLNASIEAARAGAAGKGFAVVAGEVGSLAGKTAEAAKSTTKLIETSLKAVEHGMVIANESAEMLGMMAEKANESAAVVEEIARASTEQAESIQHTIEGMDRISASVMQVNTAAQDAEMSSNTLASQSAMLAKTISHFKVDERDLRNVTAPKSAPNYEPAPAAQPAKPEAKPEQKFTPKPAPASAPKPASKPAPKIELPDDNKPAAPAPKPAAKPVSTAKPATKPAVKIELPDDNKPAAAAKPAPASAPKPAPKPTISLPDDDKGSSAPVGAPIKKATMQPVTRTVRMDPDKY